MKRNRARPIRRVLAALWMGGRFGTDVLAGVFRRAAERGGWDVRVVRFHAGMRTWRETVRRLPPRRAAAAALAENAR